MKGEGGRMLLELNDVDRFLALLMEMADILGISETM
jgi:hypothetical protein